jgi:dihydrofolate reductase
MQPKSVRIEGYAIVSADGMLADASGVMPPSLKFDADQRFFESALDRATLIVHGRNSYEDQRSSPQRLRIILTRSVRNLARDADNPNATLWNPSGATFDEALALAGTTEGTIAIIGGTEAFTMFLPRYDAFWLSQATHVRCPRGVSVFHGVPAETPQAILARHGLHADTTQLLDVAADVTLTPWRR